MTNLPDFYDSKLDLITWKSSLTILTSTQRLLSYEDENFLYLIFLK